MQNNKLQRHMDRATLAAKYSLGIPLKRHTHNLGNVVGIGCAVLVLVFFLLLILGVVVEDIMPQQPVLGWIILLLGVVALVRLALFFSTINRLADHSVVYECSEGFVVVSGSERGQAEHVLMALRWDEITQAWKEREKLGSRRPYGDPNVKYYVRDQRGRQYRLQYITIWRRCQKDLVNRSPSEDRPIV